MDHSGKNPLRDFYTISELLEIVLDIIYNKEINMKLIWLEFLLVYQYIF